MLTALLTAQLFAAPAFAQDQTQSPPAQGQNQDNQDQNTGKQKQDVPDDAGGPAGDIGPYAI
ncbi:MAG: hypothetical protein WAK21_01510, partial [Candidatus Sulfotelmatobacter sp.]